MKRCLVPAFSLALVCAATNVLPAGQPPVSDPNALWEKVRDASHHRFSTLFTAHDVKNHLSYDSGIDLAMDWCKRTAVTKVYIEAFRDGYQAERQALQHAKERFLAAGFEVSGCVTTTQVGRKSSRWNIIACYTDPQFATELSKFIRAAKPVLLTDGLARQLTNKVELNGPNVHVLAVEGDPKSLLQLSRKELDAIRTPLLGPFKTSFSAPNQVALYLFHDGSWVVENFGAKTVQVELNQQPIKVEGRGWEQHWK